MSWQVVTPQAGPIKQLDEQLRFALGNRYLGLVIGEKPGLWAAVDGSAVEIPDGWQEDVLDAVRQILEGRE